MRRPRIRRDRGAAGEPRQSLRDRLPGRRDPDADEDRDAGRGAIVTGAMVLAGILLVVVLVLAPLHARRGIDAQLRDARAMVPEQFDAVPVEVTDTSGGVIANALRQPIAAAPALLAGAIGDSGSVRAVGAPQAQEHYAVQRYDVIVTGTPDRMVAVVARLADASRVTPQDTTLGQALIWSVERAEWARGRGTISLLVYGQAGAGASGVP